MEKRVDFCKTIIDFGAQKTPEIHNRNLYIQLHTAIFFEKSGP